MSLFGRRERREIAELNEYIDRLRAQRDRFERERDTAVYNRGQVLRQLAEADAANRRMQGRNIALGQRISQLSEADPEYAAALERRVARLLKVAARLAAVVVAERQRADRVQKQMDVFLGLDVAAVAEGAGWQDRRETRMRYDKPAGEGVAS